MTGASPVLRRLSGFAALPLLSALSPFVVLPIIARGAGVDSWAAIGLGQSIGSLAAVVVIGGWSLYGPVRVASATVGERSRHYRQSLAARMSLYLLMLPVGAGIGLALLPSGQLVLGFLTIAAFAATGLSPAWFAIGVGRPALIARFEVVPRVLASLAAALVVALTGLVWVYPIALLLATALGLAAFHRRIGSGPRASWFAAVRQLWDDRSSALAVIASGLYSAVPVAVVGAFVTVHELARFSSADRMYRIGLMAVVALSNALVGWVAEQQTGWGPRSKRSLLALSGLGIIGGAALCVLSVPVSALLFGPELAASDVTSFWYGIAFLGVCVNTSLGGHILIPLKRARSVLASTLGGALLGLGAMIVLTPTAGAAGGAAGLALGEIVVCLIQGLAVIRSVRTVRSTPTGAHRVEHGDDANTGRARSVIS